MCHGLHRGGVFLSFLMCLGTEMSLERKEGEKQEAQVALYVMGWTAYTLSLGDFLRAAEMNLNLC